MSYLVLARKYRPKTFDEVIGQRPVVRTLQNALAGGRVAHALLFSGVRGVGKTTLARIVAKALSCAAGPTPSPCGRCPQCLAIVAGNSMDLQEIDGASNRGIQEIRDLKEHLRVRPVAARFRVIIIDEVHMLTTEAFNALLKTLEEPPEHVYFMFATTEIHRIPVTILSRCQRYELKRVQHQELKDYFVRIAAGEGVEATEAALALVAREAGGSVRDGLSLLDQAFSYVGVDNGAGLLDEAALLEILGLVDRRTIVDASCALLDRELGRMLGILDSLMVKGVDCSRFLHDLLSFFRLMLHVQVGADLSRADADDAWIDSARSVAGDRGPEELQRMFSFLLKGVEQIRFSSAPAMELEMTFIRMTQSRQVAQVERLLAQLERLAACGAADLPDVPVAGPPASVPVAEARTEAAPAPIAARKEAILDRPAVTDVGKTDKAPLPEAPPVGVKSLQDVELTQRELRARWEDFLAYVKTRKQWMAVILFAAEGPRLEEGRLTIRFDDQAICAQLRTAENMRVLAEFAQDFFQRELDVQVLVRTGKEVEKSGTDSSPGEERRMLATDPLVQDVLDVFGGEVEQIRTGDRNR